MKTKHSKGKWSVGIAGTVVTDNGEGFSYSTGHSETTYYGGFLIAESICKNADAKLMAASPDLLESLQECVVAMKIVNSSAIKPFIERAEIAIKKATE